MTKFKIAFVFLILGIYGAEANATQFHSLDGVDKGCKLAKFTGGKWYQSDEKEVNGQDVTNVTPSKANGDFSNFKYQNTWYASKNECLNTDSNNDAALDAGTSSGPTGSKYFAEIKLQKYLVLSNVTGASGTSSTSNGVTSNTTSYSSGLGVDGRLGYHWKENKYFFLDVSSLPASQTINYTSPFQASEPVSDTIVIVNVGYMLTFDKPVFTMKPYVAGMLGYAHLSGTVANAYTYSASGVDLGVEGGLVKEFTPHWSGLASLGLTYLSLTPKTSTSQLPTYFPLNNSLSSRAYTHFTLALGARYSF